MIGPKRLRAYVSLAAAVALYGGARLIAQPSIPRETPVLHNLAGLSELQAAFDQDSEQLRLVLLLSPTWPACIAAARWAQHDLLDRFPTARLRVLAVWFNMYPGDSRSKWPSGLLTDPRVHHYWDEQRVSGNRYLEQLPAMLSRRVPGTMQPEADAMWDAFYVYPAGDHWRDPVPLPLSWGYPIMVTHEQLAQQVETLLTK